MKMKSIFSNPYSEGKETPLLPQFVNGEAVLFAKK
jgi:hypothetical protein